MNREKRGQFSPFAYGRTEITYAQWAPVLEWAEANGYIFDNSGDMGSMYEYNFSHRTDDPVTMIEWDDAAIWCNAYSEMHGLKPLYYSDVERKNVLRKSYKYRPFRVPPEQYIHLNREKIPGMDKYSDDIISNNTKYVWGGLGRRALAYD